MEFFPPRNVHMGIDYGYPNVPTKDIGWRTFFFYLVFIASIIGIAFYVHKNIEPKGTPVSYQMTDKEQDALYCNQATHGVPVHGANASQLETYCLTHG